MCELGVIGCSCGNCPVIRGSVAPTLCLSACVLHSIAGGSGLGLKKSARTHPGPKRVCSRDARSSLRTTAQPMCRVSTFSIQSRAKLGNGLAAQTACCTFPHH
eukprot:6090851-Alexandrium_andersonii.AAC.1